MKIRCIFLLLITLIMGDGYPQEDIFSVKLYREFLENNQDMSTGELLEMYPSGFFTEEVPPFNTSDVVYLDTIIQKYNLTAGELALLQKNGFVVTERLRKESFMNVFLDIYAKDLPVYVSTDVILHAFHYSYDAILKEVETDDLINDLEWILYTLHNKVSDLDEKYGDVDALQPMLRDIDIYLTVPMKILGIGGQPIYVENVSIVNSYLTKISNAGGSAEELMFSDGCSRKIDYSQYKPRGHYVDTPELEMYFKAMIWLGRTEIYLSEPRGTIIPCSQEEMNNTIKRQIIDAAMIAEMADDPDIMEVYTELEDIISFFVGKQDNVDLPTLIDLLNESGIDDAIDLLSDEKFEAFRSTLASSPYSSQNILSQIMISDPLSPENVVPPSAFMLFGQRFTIDSYITANVVYDNILYMGDKPCRMLPSPLDILFALGNDALTHLLVPELNSYHYNTNLAGLRYLTESFPDEFWKSSLYNLWLNAIRKLNPYSEREEIPEFMKTGAWGAEKMNTQLSSWAELRHDNILYAKQSYSSGFTCEYPFGYVEPIPEFFEAMKELAEIAGNKLEEFIPPPEEPYQINAVSYFDTLYHYCDLLETIAIKELNNECITEEDLEFFNGMIPRECSGVKGPGWYRQLLYGHKGELYPDDFLIADYHTAPTDCEGSPVGWVSHAGTGHIDMLIVTARTPDDILIAYAGPVNSYREYVTTNFLRLNDDEWKNEYMNMSLRPEWVKSYLANSEGSRVNTRYRLFSDEIEMDNALENYYAEPNPFTGTNEPVTIESGDVLIIYPQPVISEAIIQITVTGDKNMSLNSLSVVDIEGRLLKTFISQNIPVGHYVTHWDLTNNSGNRVPPGIYIVRLVQDKNIYSNKLIITR